MENGKMGKKKKKKKEKKKKRKKKEKTGNWEIAPRRRCTDANLLPSRDISSFSIPSCPPPLRGPARASVQMRKKPPARTPKPFLVLGTREALCWRRRRHGCAGEGPACFSISPAPRSRCVPAGWRRKITRLCLRPRLCAPAEWLGCRSPHPARRCPTPLSASAHARKHRYTQIHTHLKPSYGSLHRLLVRTRPGCLFLPPPCPSLSTGWSQTPSNRPNTSAERGGKAPGRNNAARH